MTMPNDPTAPVPVTPPPGGEPTMPVTPAGGDATLPAQPGYAGGPDAAGSGGRGAGGSGAGGDEGFDMGKIWWILLIILIIGILIGVLIALLSGGDDENASKTRRSTTTSSSTSTTSTTSTSPTSSTTATTTASGPQVQQFTVSQNPVSCPNASATVNVTLVWSTQNTSNVTISIDNPNGPYGTYQPTGQQQVPFTCSVTPVKHTYYLTANGANNQKVQKSIVVNGSIAPASTSSTTSTT
ncbi:MAG: hypothetical protein R6X23_08720 [Acidimicrobiia bacterium]